MGLKSYLELQASKGADPAKESLTLFSLKSRLPLAWFLFFEVEDFEHVISSSDGSDYTLLRREKSSALQVARRRLAVLAKHSTPELSAVLKHFVGSVEASGGAGVLALNSHRYEATREELVESVEWLASLGAAPLTADQLEIGESIFDEGLVFGGGDDDAANDNGQAPLGLADVSEVTGWPVDAARTEWFEPPE